MNILAICRCISWKERKVLYNFANVTKQKRILQKKNRINIGQRKLVIHMRMNLLKLIKSFCKVRDHCHCMGIYIRYMIKNGLFCDCEKLIFFHLEFFLKKLISKDQAYNKAYLVWFIDSMRLINASLDTHVNNLSSKICNQKCKHCVKFIDCPKCRV